MSSIITVPGLGSHAIGAFKAKDGNNVWLRDFLPEDIPTARVLIYGYDTTITKGDTKHSITHLAIAFLDSVKAFRAATEVTLYNRSAQTLLLIHTLDTPPTNHLCRPHSRGPTYQGCTLT
jgi:hypothetical protein